MVVPLETEVLPGPHLARSCPEYCLTGLVGADGRSGRRLVVARREAGGRKSSSLGGRCAAATKLYRQQTASLQPV